MSTCNVTDNSKNPTGFFVFKFTNLEASHYISGICSALTAMSGVWEGSIPCHNCCDTGPRFLQSDLKHSPVYLVALQHKLSRSYSHSDPLAPEYANSLWFFNG